MLLRVNDNDLAVAVQGPIGADPVVLISDADSPAIRWPRPLIDLLVDQGWQVITFDHRDCGASSRATSEYTLVDMAADVLIVHSELVANGAVPDRPMHLLGQGMGGTIALLAALAQPSIVGALVLLGSTPGRTDETLPDPNDDLVDAMADRHFRPAPLAKEDKVAWLVEQARLFAGDRYPFDEWEVVASATAEVEQFWHPESGHGNAVVSTESVRTDLADISAPTLVIHGTTDPVFPVGHAECLADGLPNGELLLVEGLGHELPIGFVADYGGVIAEYFARNTR